MGEFKRRLARGMVELVRKQALANEKIDQRARILRNLRGSGDATARRSRRRIDASEPRNEPAPHQRQPRLLLLGNAHVLIRRLEDAPERGVNRAGELSERLVISARDAFGPTEDAIKLLQY